jgi:hypothetical protein
MSRCVGLRLARAVREERELSVREDEPSPTALGKLGCWGSPRLTASLMAPAQEACYLPNRRVRLGYRSISGLSRYS